MDGFDVCRKLKADKKLSDIPLVFVTALKGGKESRIRALECGAEAFLSKPIDESELTAQIRAMVKIKTAANEKHYEKERLAALVEEQTHELKESHRATLNLLEKLRRENDARKKSEEMLQESEKSLKEAQHLTQIGSWQWIVATDNVKWSEELFQINGHDSKTPAPCYAKMSSFYTPESWKRLSKAVTKALNRGESYELDLDLVRTDGNIIKTVARGVVDYDAGGKIVGMHGTVQDITDRKQIENALKINEALFRELFNNMKNGAAIFTVINDGSKGSDYIIKKINSIGLKMEGKELEEIVGKRFIDIRPTIDSYGLIPVMKKVWETGESARLPTRIYIDERYSNYYENYVFKLPSGEVVTLYDDVTESKRAEEKIKNINESLGKLNHHLYEIRENERALISREIHDELGQSLTALKIDLNWLRRQLSVDSKEGAKVEGMIDLVTCTIRDVQRISFELRPAILDDLGLSAAVEWYCEEFANRTGLQLQIEIEDVQTESISKNLAIYRVLQESLTNIIRHADAKKVKVKLCKIKKDIVLLIQDNGIGISPDKIRSSKSLGLMGMSERVKYLGGHMEITAPDKGGAIIKIYIPIK